MATRRDLRGDLAACLALPSTEHNVSHPERWMLSRWISRAAKRGFDVAFSVTVLVWLLPFLILIAVALFVESGGPVIFRQRRGGRGARLFTIYKFRTMRVLEDGPDVVQATAPAPGFPTSSAAATPSIATRSGRSLPAPSPSNPSQPGHPIGTTRRSRASGLSFR